MPGHFPASSPSTTRARAIKVGALDHLQAMLALHERSAYLADTASQRYAARRCAADYAKRIQEVMRGDA